jgi:hypothetical protein
MIRLILCSTLAAVLLAPGSSQAAETAASGASASELRLSRALAVLKGSSILIEHAASVGHIDDLSPEVSRTRSRTVVGSLAAQVTKKFSLALQFGAVQELTPTDTTLPREILLDDLHLDGSYSLPSPKEGPLTWAVGLGIDVPTSKASQSASLVLALRPSVEVTLTAPVLDGLSFTYGLSPSPRVHRYTTASTLVPYPCSPAAGCESGMTTDLGARNTAMRVAQDFSFSISALAERLSVTASLELVYSKRYGKSVSPRWSEAILSNEANGGGDPALLTSTFVLDASFVVQEMVGLSLGLWTPGGLSPTGTYYNPVFNRHSQVYFDLTFYPIDGWLRRRKLAGKVEVAE